MGLQVSFSPPPMAALLDSGGGPQHATLLSSPLLSSTHAGRPASHPVYLLKPVKVMQQQRNRKWRTRRIGKERKEQEPSPFDGRCQEEEGREQQTL